LATRYVEKARCRLDGRVVDKAHAAVSPGMVLTFALGPRVRVVRIVALGERRGPAPEARTLYDEIDPA
jgi:ribosome-associated heat shock protein Hsp15